jgi:Pentapeptide repeats (8 copies)
MNSLVPDCSQCFALCCTALPFARSADFAIDKPAGTPCVNLADDYRCRIHRELRPKGFSGCVSFDCFGAGQHVSQGTFAGISWREAQPAEMFASFDVMRQLHELLWYLADVRRRMPGQPAGDALQLEGDALALEVEVLTDQPAAELARIDVPSLRARVDRVLTRCSAEVRRRHPRARSMRGQDLIGRRLTGLRGAELRGALLIAADVSEQDLTDADLLGADLRDANLSAADVTGALFLTQSQLNAARGDLRTRIPEQLQRPAHWG